LPATIARENHGASSSPHPGSGHFRRRERHTVTASLRTAPRICVFGAAISDDWLAAMLASAPDAAACALFGACAGAACDNARVSRHGDSDGLQASAVLQLAARLFPGDDLILLRAGSALPPYWCERLLRALAEADVLVASPLDNSAAERAPLPAGAASTAAVGTIDALCYRYGRHQLLDVATWSGVLSAWSGARLAGIAPDRIDAGTVPAEFAPLRSVLLDHLYVADPSQPLRGPPPTTADGDSAPPSPLGELRELLDAALAADAGATPSAYPGVDTRPVVLHVLHGWGGGAERFVRDLAAADSERHHLVLVARGSFARRCYGEMLELCDGSLAGPPLRRLPLPNPIRSTALHHRAYAAFLYAVTREFGVGAIMVSSLIGHSLDALRTSLPTAIVGHDFYPLWPLLHRDFGDPALAFDAAQLDADLAAAGGAFEFAERDARYWTALRSEYVAAALQAGALLIAPSRSMLANLRRIEPNFTLLPQAVIAHGLAPWPQGTQPLPAPPPRARLRLLVLGRIRSGKRAELLHAALPGLRAHAEVFLLGAGAEGEQFFGRGDVHVVLEYRRDELPELLARIAPDAGLLLPTVAETFSYTLSELASLGVPVIATRVGALAERIVDGLDGWLVAPHADDIVAAVARLDADRAQLEQVRAALRHHNVRSIAAMVADYHAALPLPAAPALRYALIAASADRVLAATRAAQLGDAERARRALLEHGREQDRELARRGDWGIALERDVRAARAVIATQAETIQARTRWAEAASEAETLARQQHARLQEEFDERSQWAQSLDAELQRMRASTSWRITRPLRFVMRKLRGARVRLAFTLQRLRSIAQRTRGSVARRGTVGTLRRIGDEFRRAGEAPRTAIVAAPGSDFAAFALATSDTPQVSIVMPVYNKIDYTVACLRSIDAHASATDFEVIVVDDASSDASAERLAQIGGIRVVRNDANLGFVGSCNAGAAQARGEFILFLNNDTVVTADWLDALLRVFAEEPDAGLAGSRLVYPDGRLQEAGGIVFSDGSGWNYGRFDDPADPRYAFRREADYCSGAAIVLPRALFEQLGGFDTRYAPAYYEDTDLAFAVRAAGRKVFYEPRSLVVHFEGITAGTDTGSGMKRFQAINRDKFVAKWQEQLARQPAPIHDARQAEAAANHRARGRVLIVDAYTPTPDQDSGSLRMVNLMRLLRELGYAVAFLPDNRAHAGPYTEALQALGVEALYHPFVADPVAWLREHGATLDAIVLSRHYIAVNYVGPARLYAPRARLIFDTVDLHYLREERAAALEGKTELARLAAQTRAQELKLMRTTDVTLVVSAAEKRLLDAELPGARIEVLSNVHAVHGCRTPFAARSDLVFVGGFQHPPNVDAVCWFVAEVMPLLRDDGGEAMRLHVIGSKVPPQVLALACDDVVVHGFVADIEPYLDGCRLSVAPLRYGAGVKGKINMAMSYGLPVVATAVAVEGMHLQSGSDVLVADSAVDFAAAIRRAYHDAELWQNLSDRGLANVREHFSFDAARAALVRVLPARS
jgi:GT2 family glycosyltransferase/glycosyltransferase involved in cell wall biosynthesis